MQKPSAPTREQFAAYEKMFAYFNAKLFAGGLPPCLLNFSRRSKSHGFFAPERWEKGKDVRHEISLNPSTLKSRKPVDVASTLVHEMAHLWQQEHGTPSRSGYHNREWADKMQAIGLVPSSTGEPGGDRVGQRMTHYVDAAGAFLRAFRAMPSEFLFPWACEEPDGEGRTKAPKNKVKYTCDGCGANVWGKPDLAITCDDCDAPFEADA